MDNQMEFQQDFLIRVAFSKLVITSAMSTGSIIFNSLLLMFFISHNDFHSLSFGPVMIQTIVDILGPGFANLVYEYLSYKQLTGEEMQNFMSLSVDMDIGSLQIYSTLRSWTGCFLTFFRSLLNTYSTGFCILATAFIRYILICHPTSDLLKNFKFLISISLSIVGVIIVSILLEIALLIYEYVGSTESEKYNLRFLVGCFDSMKRQTVRLVIDIVLYFGVPALISCYCYLRVGIVLLTRDRNQTRNRNLSIALFLSWLLWILCWTPAYWALSLDFDETGGRSWYEKIKEGSFLSWFNIYFILLHKTIQMTYSHLNAFVFLIVLNPFRAWIFTNIKTFWGKLVRKINIGVRKAMFAIFILVIVIFAPSSCVSTMVLAKRGVYFKQDSFIAFEQMRNVRATVTLMNDNFKDLHSSSYDIKYLCAENHAFFNFKYQRCFFIGSNSNFKLNFSQQVEYCSSRNSNLAYPRTKHEKNFLWDFYKKFRGWDRPNFQIDESDDWFLHLGMIRANRGSMTVPKFTSIDKKFNFSAESQTWLTVSEVMKPQRKLRGPVLCISQKMHHLFDCLRRTKRGHWICSIDFSPTTILQHDEYDYDYGDYDDAYYYDQSS